MARYSTVADTPDDLRLGLIEELKRRRETAKASAAGSQISVKRRSWEQGRADCYGDLIEFLNELKIEAKP